MRSDRHGFNRGAVAQVGAASLVSSIALMLTLGSGLARPLLLKGGTNDDPHAVQIGYSDDLREKQDFFNRNLALKVDTFTILQRVDRRNSFWIFHFRVSYYINKVQEFQEKRHASMVGTLCMDKAFVRSLKDSGPFLYRNLDPSGQTADVVLPQDDCGE